MGYSSYYVSLGSNMTQQLRGWFGSGGYNQEVVPFSQALYTARDLGMYRLVNMARRLNAFGVVGMHIDYNRNIEEYETENPSRYYLDLFVHFSVIGTAIRAQKQDHVIPEPKLTLSFTDLRPGQRGETRELTIRE